MNHSLSPEDPQLTAYALGELEGDERAAVEAALRRDPSLRLVVEDIRAAAGRVEAALANETVLPVSRLPAEMASPPQRSLRRGAQQAMAREPAKINGTRSRRPPENSRLLMTTCAAAGLTYHASRPLPIMESQEPVR